MTKSEATMSTSFETFYMDASLTGHLFLRPSIYVGRSYQRIFSSNPYQGLARIAEVFTRVLLFALLPLLALLSLPLIPLGMIFKGISVQFSAPSVFYSKEEAKDGKLNVLDNGDCLFESFHVNYKLSQPNASQVKVTREDVAKERLETVQWMREHYKNDKNLQNMLLQSMEEHYQAKKEKIREDLDFKQTQVISNELKAVIAKLAKECEELERIGQQLTDTICTKNEEDPLMLLPIIDVVESYMREMEVQGVFGGAAELYALSSRHQRCITVHKPLQRPETLNEHFVTEKAPAFHFFHDKSHYNVYFPAK